MHKRSLPKLLTGFILLCSIIWSCTKLDTTTLGSDLIPAVDNINTFADTIEIESTQDFYPDSLVRIFREGNQVLGNINNDPVFGKTNANIYFQLKPTSYPFNILAPEDTLISIDSVVLTLSYLGSYGEKWLPQTLEVSEVLDDEFRDSVYVNHPINYQPTTTGVPLATTQVDILSLANYVKFGNGKDSSKNQIRIKLADNNMNTAFMTTLFNRDTAKDAHANNAFRNDSIFKRFYNGFAVKSIGTNSNSLMYISLTDANTRLELHYKKKSGSGPDTTYKSFVLNSNELGFNSPSASANYISRDYSGTNVLSGSSTEHYLQTSPGTSINLKLLGLDTIPNRIVHRASIIIEQIPDATSIDSTFSVPSYMYVDLKDTGSVLAPKFKPLYFDLNPSTVYYPDNNGSVYFPSGGIDQFYFGGASRRRSDRKYYDINITRYVQQILTDNTPNYELRLFPAYTIRYPQYSTAYITYDNPPAFGRITVGSGSSTNPNYRMRLIMIYSEP